MDNISTRLLEVYSSVIDEVEFEPGLKIPPEAYNSGRKQYEAEIVLQRMHSEVSLPKEGKVLGVTAKDLYSPGLNFVFGQAREGGRVAVVSLHRLRPEFWGRKESWELFLNRAAKEAIHELGHTFGLIHCGKKSCVMTFSNCIADTDGKKLEFCKNCRRKIEKKPPFR